MVVCGRDALQQARLGMLVERQRDGQIDGFRLWGQGTRTIMSNWDLPSMLKRACHLVIFFIGAMTISAFGITLSLTLEIVHPATPTSTEVLPIVRWVAISGGFICASIVTVKTAWSFYYMGGKLERYLSQNVKFPRW